MDAEEEHARADDLTKKGPQDAARINLSEDFEVRYGSHKFGVSEYELRRAVGTVGDSVAAVERELAG